MTTRRVVVVDDDFRVARIHHAYVERVDGFTVVGVAHTCADARDMVTRLEPDLVVLDVYLPDGSGLDLLDFHRASDDHRPDFLVITAANDLATVRRARVLGATHLLVKPFRFADLQARLEAYRRWRATLDEQRVDGTADQRAVDSVFADLYRGISHDADPTRRTVTPTLDLVRRTVDHADHAVSATEVATTAGISRATAQRYLTQLEQRGDVELTLRYGSTGRPENLYRRPRS